MDFLGLITRYPVGHVLSQEALGFRLRQDQKLSLQPHYQLSVIQMNSTYLETVDKWFAWKGMITAFALFLLFAVTSTLGWGALVWILEATGIFPSPFSSSFLLANGLGMALLVACLDGAFIWLLRKESFAYTHYPIRFNRKTRTVHVFRTNGTILSTPWGNIFFTLEKIPPWDEWEVRGHILGPDGITIKETFALSHVGSFNASNGTAKETEFSCNDDVLAHWEFIRRYMEDGPEEVSEQVNFCMPVNKRHEKIRVGIERIFANISSAPLIFYWILFPFCAVISIFRIIAMRTSKIPQWSGDIEEGCKIDEGDRYAIEGNPNGDRIYLYPDRVTPDLCKQSV